MAHGVVQGGISAAQGGKFISGFASGSLSSFAASLWSGGGSGEWEWQGLGGKFADKGIGTILFGTVAGGLGAELSGGIPIAIGIWRGAATGLIVSGLNHVVHSWPKPKINNGEVYNWFDKEKNPVAYEYAENYSPKQNTISLFTHGSADEIIGPDGKHFNSKDLHGYLLKNSKLYNSNKTISIELKACYTGIDWQFGFALTLSNLRPSTFVIGANSYWWSDNTLDYGGKWNTFINGRLFSQSFGDIYRHRYPGTNDIIKP